MTSDAKVRWIFIAAFFMAVGFTALYLLTKLAELALWIQALYLVAIMVSLLLIAFIIVDGIETLIDNRWRKQNKLKKEKEEREHRSNLYINLPTDMTNDGKNALVNRIILDEQRKKQINNIVSKKAYHTETIDRAQQTIRDLDATLREIAPEMFPDFQAENMKEPVEKEFIPKIDTHFVMKKEHARTWLTPTQYKQLSDLITRVHMKRLSKGIPAPEYWVINKDEPYSYKIENVIQEGETKK